MTDSVAIIRQHAWGRLYNAANAVAARIGADGEIGTGYDPKPHRLSTCSMSLCVETPRIKSPVREVRMMEQLALPLPRVLDPCCGSRMWWFDRQHPDAIYGDQREEQHILCDGRTLRIEPDVLLDFRSLPFPDGRFNLVAFDPPHLRHAGKTSWMAAKYGKLGEDWRDDLRQGFAECFRVLASDGVLVFKWNETQVKVREVLALTPEQPLFGNTSGKKAGTHWYVFMKKPPTPKATL